MVSKFQTGIVKSELNSSSSTLGSGASFTGTGEDVSKFAEISVNLFGNPSSAPGTLFFEYSPDGVNWDVSVSYTLAGPQSFVPLPLRNVLPFFRVRYVNGATPLTEFRLTSVYHWMHSKQITRVINQSIDENEPVEMTRSILAGKSPNGPYTNLPATGVSDSQSTSTPLSSGATFNSAGIIVDMTGYVSVSVSLKSNVNSATNGLVFQWFSDSSGTILLKESSFTYGSAPNGIKIQVSRQGPFFRIKYTNGGTNQSSFNLVTELLVTSPPSDVLTINEIINDTTTAQIVKSQLVGKQENDTYSNVSLSNSASMKVAVTDRPSEVRNRVHVHVVIPRTILLATPTTLYTVTSGKILYIQSISLSMINNSNSIGEWHLRDSTTVKSPYLIEEMVAGSAVGSRSSSPSLPEPMRFNTNINAIKITGGIEISGYLIGYEE